LPGETSTFWEQVAPLLPADAYLGGGTAIAVHLRHRQSRDLGFFFHEPVDIDELVKQLGYDVADDPFLPVERDEVARYWQGWQPQIVAAVERHGITGPLTPDPPVPGGQTHLFWAVEESNLVLGGGVWRFKASGPPGYAGDMLSPSVENLVAQLTRLPGSAAGRRSGSRFTCRRRRRTRSRTRSTT
jgi:hypothetical protein